MQQLYAVNLPVIYLHCILWLFVRAGENFPLIVVMLADTPWANASSSFVPQLGLLLCFSMFDALNDFVLRLFISLTSGFCENDLEIDLRNT